MLFGSRFLILIMPWKKWYKRFLISISRTYLITEYVHSNNLYEHFTKRTSGFQWFQLWLERGSDVCIKHCKWKSLELDFRKEKFLNIKFLNNSYVIKIKTSMILHFFQFNRYYTKFRLLWCEALYQWLYQALLIYVSKIKNDNK